MTMQKPNIKVRKGGGGPKRSASSKTKGPVNGGRTTSTAKGGISRVTVVGSNLKSTGFRSLMRSFLGPVNPDKGVLVDPFEHLETNQYLKKTDTTDCILQARECVTKEEISKIDFFSKANIAVIPISKTAVHRLMWTPPYVTRGGVNADTSIDLEGDRRGVFSDIDGLTISFKNLLSQPIVVSLNSPRSRIQNIDVVQFRDYERRATIGPGASHSVTMHWGDKSNIKSPLARMIQTEKAPDGKKNAPALPVIEVIDYMVEYPEVDRESNSVYLDDTEVVAIRATMGYVVNANYPPQLSKVVDRPIFMTVGSTQPNEDLFGLQGVSGEMPVASAGSADINTVSLRSNTAYPYIGLAPCGKGENHKLSVINRDNTHWESVELPLYKTQLGVRLIIPGIAATKDGVSHSTFAYSNKDDAWVLWDEFNNSPLHYHLTDTRSTYINSGVQGHIMDTCATAIGTLELTVADIVGFLDSITHVVGLIAGVVGLFA